ncbi:MAG: T9SS type A sorting domain-containing protein [Fibromonadaceae bacterium]|nr:T9SS type A sorting domain-containing protein [Fibromonadaceae bacterium]
MNKLQKAGLATVAALGMAFAQGNLWGPDPLDFPSLQVRVPDVLNCIEWAENAPGDLQDNLDVCNEQAAGWWYGFADDGDGTAAGRVEVRLKTGWTNFENQDLTDRGDGEPLIEGPIEARLTTTNTQYANAAVGFNFYPDAEQEYWGSNNPRTQNVTSYGGYCMTYTLTNTDDPMEMELGWDEAKYCFDSWYAEIEPSISPKMVNIPWSNFSREGWLTTEAHYLEQQSKGCSDQNGAIVEAAKRETALENATSVKVRMRNGGEAEARNNIMLTIYQFGWLNSCNTTVPIQSKGVALNPVKFDLVNRTLSMISVEKLVSVQIINLHGAVVHTQTISPNSNKINLSNMPTGVYLVRVPSLGYVSKITLR